MSSDPFSTVYTPEELAALPKTETVFDKPPLIANEHDWTQEGYYITDACNPKKPSCHPGGLPIGNGNMLIKNKEGYRIVDEVTRQ